MSSSEERSELPDTAPAVPQHEEQTVEPEVVRAGPGTDQPLFFQGTTAEAITKASGKKLLIVYIAGEEGEPTAMLDSTTWTDEGVASYIREACVALRLRHGSPDARFFSAIYPVATVPTIAVIGLNGSRLHWLEGYVTAETLRKKLEEANATFQLQLHEVAAAATMAALLSAIQPTRQTATEPPPNQTCGPSPPAPAEARPDQTPPPPHPAPAEPTADQRPAPPPLAPAEPTPKQTPESPPTVLAVTPPTQPPSCPPQTDQSPVPSSSSSPPGPPPVAVPLSTATPSGKAIAACPPSEEVADTEDATKVLEEPPSEPSPSQKEETEKVLPLVDAADPSRPPKTATTASAKSTSLVGGVTQGLPQIPPSSARSQPPPGAQAEPPPSRRGELPSVAAASAAGPAVRREEEDSGRVQVQFRLTDGSSVRGEFGRRDTLRAAREFLNRERTDGRGGYDLAVPFPRHVFTEAEMDATLEALGFASRTALVLLPRGGPSEGAAPSRGAVPSAAQNEGGAGQGWSLTGMVGGALSYVNPLSLLRGRPPQAPASRDEAPPSGGWEYDPNPALERQLRMHGGGGASAASGSSSMGGPLGGGGPLTGAKGTSGSKRLVGNVHTFNRDDNDDMNPRKNMFYNGNSTQFGGDGNDNGGR